MKKIIAVLIVALFLFPTIVLAQQGKDDALVMKRDLLQERVLRIQAELGLMRVQFRDAQMALQAANKELQEINAKIELATPEVKKPEKQK